LIGIGSNFLTRLISLELTLHHGTQGLLNETRSHFQMLQRMGV